MMRLIDCFMHLIVYVIYSVRHMEELQPDFETIKSTIDRKLSESQKIKEDNHFSNEDYNYARLSVCVWIDEAILNSSWDHKRQWQRELLQLRYYNITDGGMEFFDRLDKIGHEDRDVREVAYYCLSLGLSGRYIEKGDRVVLDHLKSSNLKRLYGSSAGEPTLDNRLLFPEAYQKHEFVPPPKNQTWRRHMPAIVISMIPIGLFAALMVAYQYLLKLDLDKFAPM